MGRLQAFEIIARQHCKMSELDNMRRTALLKRREKEIKSKLEQISKEIEGELDDFYDYLFIKNASVETLGAMKDYLSEQLKNIQMQLTEEKGEAS